MSEVATRGTTNGNARGSAADRRRRRAWMMGCYASNVEGFVRCYRCGALLYNPDDHPDWEGDVLVPIPPTADFPYSSAAYAKPLTVDRIIPGCKGGTYRQNNVRPACMYDNASTGSALGRKS